jgi:polysaccharide biosynthesis/export protein
MSAEDAMNQLVPIHKLALIVLAITMAACGQLSAQDPLPGGTSNADWVPAQEALQLPKTADTPTRTPRRSYRLGAADVLDVFSSQVEVLKSFAARINDDGTIRLPMVGPLSVAGSTLSEAERDINAAFERFYKNPDILVSVKEYRPRPVSVIGAVQNPGVVEIEGEVTLFEVLGKVGGFQPDASYTIRITRRQDLHGPLDLESATSDESGKFSSAEIPIENLYTANTPATNLTILPYDVVMVPKAKMVYILGSVIRPGGFALQEGEAVTTLQALVLAGGYERFANPGKARILRKDPDSMRRREIAIDMKDVLVGKEEDLRLRADDILYIPDNSRRKLLTGIAVSAATVATGVITWRLAFRR